MIEKKKRRIPIWVYWVSGLAVISLLAGFTIGTLTVGTFGSTPRQTSATGIVPGGPSGVEFIEAEYVMIPSSGADTPVAGDCPSSNLGSALAPTPLANGVNTTLCLSTSVTGFALGDLAYVLQVGWNQTSSVSTTFEVQVYLTVTPATNDLVATSYVATSSAITANESAIYTVDLTQSSISSISGFSVLVTQE